MTLDFLTRNWFLIVCGVGVLGGVGLLSIEVFGRLWDRMFGPKVLRERETGK